MRKTISLIIVINILLSFAAFVPAFATSVTGTACGNNLIWTLDTDGTLTVSGNGEMWNKNSLSVQTPWESEGIPLKKVVIEEGVTSVGAYIFAECKDLESVVLPDSLTKIKEYAFKGCTKLADIDIPEGVTEIGPYAFYCDPLTEIIIPAGVTELEKYVFASTNIKAITIPEGVTVIKQNAFEMCS